LIQNFLRERIHIAGSTSVASKQKLLSSAKGWTAQQSDGLPYETHLQIGGEYFVSTNIDVTDGLFNGSTGHLKLIEYGTTSSRERIPKRAWMDL